MEIRESDSAQSSGDSVGDLVLSAVKKLIALLALLLIGCAPGPSNSQLQTDFAARYPGCELLSSVPGEGDDANVYYMLTFRCGASHFTQSTEFLYQFQDDRWVTRPEATQRPGQAPDT